MQALYALSATTFFTAFASLICIYGQNTSRMVVLAALLVGAVSQFAAQDPQVVKASNRLAQFAIVLSVLALGLFGYGI